MQLQREKRRDEDAKGESPKAASKPVPMTPRFHLFPFRTQKLSLVVPKILGWRRPGKIGRCRHFSFYGPLVKRLRRRPLTAKTGVRFSQGSPFFPAPAWGILRLGKKWGIQARRCKGKRADNLSRAKGLRFDK